MITTKILEPAGDKAVVSAHGVEFSREDVLQQLERLIASRHFRNSKRYPSLLRFVVEQILAGNTEGLKERTLGIHVFNKPNDYDTNSDPVVRVTAGEIRKRLAQYYQEPEHKHELRIDLPLGSYMPQIFAADDPRTDALDHGPEHTGTMFPVALEEPARTRSFISNPDRRGMIILSGLLLVCLIVAVAATARAFRNRRQDQSVSVVWRPAFSSANPALIVIGVHTLDSTGHDIPPDVNASATHDRQQSMLSSMISSDMIPVSDLVSYSKITDLLTRRSHPYSTKGSTDTTLDELRQGPVILIGALDNVWTMRLASKLRYKFFANTAAYSGIVDTQHPSTVWTFDNTQRALANSRDYAIVASYFDPGIEQHVIIAAGVGKTGTQAASEFLTGDKYLKSWLTESKVPSDRNFELVLSTEILDGRAGPPKVIAGYTW